MCCGPGPLSPAAPAAPCPFRIMAPEVPTAGPGSSRDTQRRRPALDACACSRGSHPLGVANRVRCPGPRPQPGHTPPPDSAANGLCRGWPGLCLRLHQRASGAGWHRQCVRSPPHALSVPRDWVLQKHHDGGPASGAGTSVVRACDSHWDTKPTERCLFNKTCSDWRFRSSLCRIPNTEKGFYKVNTLK